MTCWTALRSWGVWCGIKKWWPWSPYKRLSGIKPRDSQYKKRNHELSGRNSKLMQGKCSFRLIFLPFLNSVYLEMSLWWFTSGVIFLSWRSALMLFKWCYLMLPFISTALLTAYRKKMPHPNANKDNVLSCTARLNGALVLCVRRLDRHLCSR